MDPDAPLTPLPPEAFSGWWLACGIVLAALALAVALVPWLVARLRRRPRAPEPAPAPPPAAPVDRRSEALARIDRIEAAWVVGDLTDRAAAQAIAQAVKGFAGSDAETLTLLDLKFRGERPDLVEVIEAAYPVEFGVKGEGDVGRLAARAREVVAA